MIIRIFKKIRETRRLQNKRYLQKLEQNDKFRQKLFKILEDEHIHDITYVIYSSEFPNLSSSFVEAAVISVSHLGGFSYDKRFYPEGYVFYIYVKKREDPKYNVGDVYHQKETEFDRPSDLLILGRSYDGKGRYVYATIQAYHPLSISESKIYWRYLDD